MHFIFWVVVVVVAVVEGNECIRAATVSLMHSFYGKFLHLVSQPCYNLLLGRLIKCIPISLLACGSGRRYRARANSWDWR